MSVFKKPKRNIRRRDLDNDENEVEDTESSQMPSRKTLSKSSSDMKTKKEKKKPSVLSFEEEWNEG